MAELGVLSLKVETAGLERGAARATAALRAYEAAMERAERRTSGFARSSGTAAAFERASRAAGAAEVSTTRLAREQERATRLATANAQAAARLASAQGEYGRAVEILRGSLRGLEKDSTTALRVQTQLANAQRAAARVAQGKAPTLFGQVTQDLAGLTRFTQAIQALPGPLGTVAAQMTSAGSAASGLFAVLGSGGAAALGAVAAFGALGTAVVKFVVEGSRTLDTLGDIAQVTGFTEDQIQRLDAAFTLAGEDVQGAERAFVRFSDAIVEGIQKPSSEAGQALRQLGIDAKKAGTDPQAAFIEMLRNLEKTTGSSKGLAAAYQILGRQAGGIIRSSGELAKVLSMTTEELQQQNLVAGPGALAAGQMVDSAINMMIQGFKVLHQRLTVSQGPEIAQLLQNLSKLFNDLAPVAVSAANTIIDGFAKVGAMLRQDLDDLRRFRDFLARGMPWIGRSPQQEFDPNQFRTGVPAPNMAAIRDIRPKDVGIPTGMKRDVDKFGAVVKDFDKAVKARKPARAKEEQLSEEVKREVERAKTFIRVGQLDEAGARAVMDEARTRLAQLNAEATILARTAGPAAAKQLAIVRGQVEDTFAEWARAASRLGAIRMELDRSLPELPSSDLLRRTAGMAGMQIPGVQLPPATLDEGRDYLGVKTLAEGLRETFRNAFGDFTQSILVWGRGLRESFGYLIQDIGSYIVSYGTNRLIDNALKDLIDTATNWLSKAFTSLFKKIGDAIASNFGGVTKGITGLFSSIFGGFFATGGFLPTGRFGVVGERGPELVFAGAGGAQILSNKQMLPANVGGRSYNLNINVSGAMSAVEARKTGDQVGRAALQAIRRAERQGG